MPSWSTIMMATKREKTDEVSAQFNGNDASVDHAEAVEEERQTYGGSGAPRLKAKAFRL